MRPLYETQNNRDSEAEIAAACASAWGCEATKLKVAAELDYVFHRAGAIQAVAEIKDRTVGRGYSSSAIDGMGGYMIAASKYQAAKRWCEAHTVAFILVVRLTDGIFWRKWVGAMPNEGLRLGGRSDRDDWQDKEPCVFLPMSTFKPLTGSPNLKLVPRQ